MSECSKCGGESNGFSFCKACRDQSLDETIDRRLRGESEPERTVTAHINFPPMLKIAREQAIERRIAERREAGTLPEGSSEAPQ